MKINKLIFYITAGFIVGTISLIAMQSVTSSNVQGLIVGNENLLKEFNINNELAELQKDILVYDNKLKNVVITGNSSKAEGLDEAVAEIEDDITTLQKIKTNQATEKFIDDLDSLVHQKLAFNKQVINSFNSTGKPAAVEIFSTQRGNKLSESISLLTEKNDITRQQLLSEATKKINRNGQLALLWGILIIAVVLALFTVVFWFILNRMKKQHSLINELNTKEEKLKQALKVKENFLANMSHEIRTPMTAILGYTNLLQKRKLDEESGLYVSTIQRSGENLLAIINDILDLSKIEAGMMRIEEAPFSIRELVHNVAIMFKNKAAEKGLFLKTFVDPNIPDTLLGDETRLTQVLVNLVGNAVKFTIKGEITLQVSTRKNDKGINQLQCIVKDTGIGIEKEKLETIFERFSQAEESTTRQYGGTGLGLSIVRDIVNLQHGILKIESQPGEGTAVTFSIPYKVSITQTIPRYAENNIQPRNFKNGIKILLAEDNKINQGLVSYFFNEWNIDYAIAGNGKEALSILEKKSFDLILMDIQMPVMDGYIATREIRQTLKLDIPIIAMTAHAMEGDREKCLEYGMNEHISKPIRENLLYSVITQFVDIQAREINGSAKSCYNTIDLTYMHEISKGDTEYEKIITEQFIKQIPEEIMAMCNALETGNRGSLKKIAHNMKTSISIMGLNELLDTHLETIENNGLNPEQLKYEVTTINGHLKKALAEAGLFFQTL